MADVQLSTLGAVVKTAYEGEADTNAYTDAEKAQLAAFSTVFVIVTGTTLTLSDALHSGKVLVFTNAAAIAVTVPDTLSVNFECTGIQTTAAGVPTFTPNTDTINGAGAGVAPSAQWKALYLGKFAATELAAVL